MDKMENKFFKKRNGNYYTIFTKEEIYKDINNKAERAMKYCKLLDIPFIQSQWDMLLHRYPNKNIFGRYRAKMTLLSWRQFGYYDSIFLNGKIK